LQQIYLLNFSEFTHKDSVEISCKFLLLARYVPNVAKKSIWDQWK